MNNFRTWLSSSIDEVDRLYDHPMPDVEVAERAAAIAHEAGDRAARLGFSELHQASRQFSGMAELPAVKSFLAACLGACPQDQQPPALLSVEHVASMLNASPSHVYRLSDAGQMPPPVKIGALVRWVKTDIEAWIAGGCRSVRSLKLKRGA